MNVPDPDAPWIRTALLLGWEPWRIEELANHLKPEEHIVMVRYEGILLEVRRHAVGAPVLQILHRSPDPQYILAMRYAAAKAGFSSAWFTGPDDPSQDPRPTPTTQS